MIAEFERTLFEPGTFDWPTNEIVGDFTDRYYYFIERNSASTGAKIEYLESGYWQANWRNYYRGRIPVNWGISPHDIADDLREAKSCNIQLSSILVEAALSHPENVAAVSAGTYQRLNLSQLAQLLARNLSEEELSDIYVGQIDFGLTDEIWEEALKESKKIDPRDIPCLQEANRVIITCELKPNTRKK